MKPRIMHIGICTGTNGLTKALREHSSEYVEISTGDQKLNENTMAIAEQLKPDIVFMQIQCAGVILKSTVDYLKRLGAWVVNWNGDVRDETPDWMLDLGPLVTTMFTNMRDVNVMRNNGFKAEWLEIGYDPEIYRPGGEVIKTHPIVFMGNNVHGFPMSKFRTDMVKYLKLRFPGLVGLYGMAQGSDGNFNHSQSEENKAYQYAKIAINCSHYEIEKYSSDRLLRIMGSGTLCLAKGYPGIDTIFKDGCHLRVWNTLEELEALCHWYLDPRNEEERLTIARQGQEFVERTFTFNCMIENLIKFYHEQA